MRKMTLAEINARNRRHDSPPVFNKRLFRAQAGIVMTNETIKTLKKPFTQRRSEELHDLKSVVCGLKAIHKDLQIIKEALCYCVKYERFDADVDVKKKSEEDVLSCYYVLSGSVEGKYTVNSDQEENCSNTCYISYIHVAGEYLGLVSCDGPNFDLPPPDEMRSLEPCEFLRIDRQKFHQKVKWAQNRYVREIEHYINNVSILRKLPYEEKSKLVPLMTRQEYQAGRVIISQGEIPEHVFFVAEGRCQFYRKLYIEEVNREELVRLGQVEQGEFFGESTLIDSTPSFCSVASIGMVTCYLVNKWTIKTNDNIIKLLRNHRHCFTNDDAIKLHIRDSDLWQNYKRRTITKFLTSVGKDSVALGQQDIPSPLFRAVEFGEANRRHSSQIHVHCDKTPGAPKPDEKLFVAPRVRRRSSAILTSNAAAVVKAVLLLRRNGGEYQPSPSEPSPSPSNNSPAPSLVRFPQIKLNSQKDRRIRNTNALQGRIARNKSAPVTIASRKDLHHETLRCKSVSALEQPEKSKSDCKKDYQHKRRTSSKSCKNVVVKSGPIVPTKRVKEEKQENISKRAATKHDEVMPNRKLDKRNIGNYNIALPDVKEKSLVNGGTPPSNLNQQHKQSSKSPTERTEKRNIVIKEIINTGYPGQNAPPSSYRRFPPSMFQLLDKPKAEQGKQEVTYGPWLVGMAAKKWKSAVERSKVSVQDLEPPPSPSSQTPLIVIEEWLTAEKEENVEEKQTEDDNFNSTPGVDHIGKVRKTSRNPSPLLSDVREESEEDVQKYEEEDITKEIWYTPIHEAREQSQQQLEQVRKELEKMKILRRQMKRQSSLEDTGSNSYKDGDNTEQRRKSSGKRSDESSEESQASEKEEQFEKLYKDSSSDVMKRTLSHSNSEASLMTRKRFSKQRNKAYHPNKIVKKSKSVTSLQGSKQLLFSNRKGKPLRTSYNGDVSLNLGDSRLSRNLEKILDKANKNRISNYMHSHKQECKRNAIQKWI